MSTRTFLPVLLLSCLALAGCRDRKPAPPPEVLPPAEAARVLRNHVWLDKMPESQTERFHLALFLDRSIGVYQDRTVWKGDFEMFEFKLRDDRVELSLPGSRKVVKTKWRIERVRDGDFDYRLVFDDAPRGPKAYWGLDIGRQDVDSWLALRGLRP